MNKKLIAYFSCSGVTKRASEKLTEVLDADLFEILPKEPYTNADLNWMDKKSRSTLEMNDPNCRPAIANKVSNMSDYDVIFLGFPIWWYVEPSIINTFLESYDFSGKTIVPFATSGGSGFGDAEKNMKTFCANSTSWEKGKMLNGKLTKENLSSWINSLNLDK